jgi:hypothetical protein
MKAIKTTGSINEQGQIQIDRPLIGEESDPNTIEDESKETILADFRQAWHEAITGQTVPASQIWEGIEHDST